MPPFLYKICAALYSLCAATNISHFSLLTSNFSRPFPYILFDLYGNAQRRGIDDRFLAFLYAMILTEQVVLFIDYLSQKGGENDG